jgi:hypothetical protein
MTVKNPAKKRLTTTPEIVLDDQTGPAAGTRAAMRIWITAQTSQIAPNIETQPTLFRAFDPHFGHATLLFMGLVRVTMGQKTGRTTAIGRCKPHAVCLLIRPV